MRKILKQAKLIVAVESYKGKSIVENNPNLTIQTLSIYDNRTNEFWSEERIEERGIKYFSVYPSIDIKDIWIYRMKSMGYEKSLIKKIQDNFDQLIFNMQSENSPLVYKYQLTERTPSVNIDILNFVASHENSFVTNFHNKVLV